MRASGQRRAAILSALTRRGSMKFLLTSAGIKNASIHNALVGLLGKPIAECRALRIPTAIYPLLRADLPWLTGSSADQPPVPSSNWVGSRWACSSSRPYGTSKPRFGWLRSGSRRGEQAGRGASGALIRDIAEGGLLAVPIDSDEDLVWLGEQLASLLEAHPERRTLLDNAVDRHQGGAAHVSAGPDSARARARGRGMN